MKTTTTSKTYPVIRKSQSAYNLHSQTQDYHFAVPFSRMSDSQIEVLLDGVPTSKYFLNLSIVIINAKDLEGVNSVTIRRRTEVDAAEPAITELAEFQAGHPLKADDLNQNFLLTLQQIQEQLAVIQSTIPVVADQPPPKPYKGQLWISSKDWRIHVWNGTVWVDVH